MYHFNVFLIFLFLLCSCNTNKVKEDKIPLVNAENALEKYLENDDDSFAWEIKESYDIGDVKAYIILLTSQNWRNHIWKHQLTVLVPPEVQYDGALLYITGKAVKNGLPQWRSHDDELTQALSELAVKNKAITTILWQVPNQPLYDDLTEDQLISYTLHNFKNDGDYSWPLLFPMVKSAKKAMDAIQQFGLKEIDVKINRFVVSGASKRGWTTWLTSGHDNRVKGIAPMVIDVLNMPVNLNYQKEAWGDYSVQIEDYVRLGIVQEMGSTTGDEITRMIDPYSYRSKYTMPKMIIIGTNDEYWPVDAIKHYFYNIPGENYIHYVANVGHGLGGGAQALKALSGFFGHTLKKEMYPKLTWEIDHSKSDIQISVHTTSDQLVGSFLWTSDSNDRDFRDNEFVKADLEIDHKENVQTKIKYPDSGYRAFYIDLEYMDPNGGSYTKSTRMYVADDDEVFE